MGDTIGDQGEMKRMKRRIWLIVLALVALHPGYALGATEQEVAGARSNDTPPLAEVVASTSLAAAFPPLGRGATVQGRLDAASGLPQDVDCFGFHAEYQQALSVHVVGQVNDTPDTVLELRAPNGALVARSDDEGLGFTSALSAVASSTGEWSACVRAYGSAYLPPAAFAYTLVLSASEASSDPGISQIELPPVSWTPQIARECGRSVAWDAERDGSSARSTRRKWSSCAGRAAGALA